MKLPATTLCHLRSHRQTGLFSSEGVTLMNGKEKMFEAITETLENDFPAWFGKVFSYASNPGLILPFILIMVMAIYYLNATSKAYLAQNLELRKKLQLQAEESKKRSKKTSEKAAEDAEPIANPKEHKRDGTPQKEHQREDGGHSNKRAHRHNEEGSSGKNLEPPRIAVTRPPGPRAPSGAQGNPRMQGFPATPPRMQEGHR